MTEPARRNLGAAASLFSEAGVDTEADRARLERGDMLAPDGEGRAERETVALHIGDVRDAQ